MKIFRSTIKSVDASIPDTGYIKIVNMSVATPQNIYFCTGGSYPVLSGLNDTVWMDSIEPANRFLASLGDDVSPLWDFYCNARKELDRSHEGVLSLTGPLSKLVIDLQKEFSLVEKIIDSINKRLKRNSQETTIGSALNIPNPITLLDAEYNEVALLAIVTISKLMMPVFGSLFTEFDTMVFGPTGLNGKELDSSSIIEPLLKHEFLSHVFNGLIRFTDYKLTQLQSNELHCGFAFMERYFITQNRNEFILRVISYVLTRHYINVNLHDTSSGVHIQTPISKRTESFLTSSIKSAIRKVYQKENS